MPIIQSSLNVIGGSIDYSYNNTGLILGICIPMAIISNFLFNNFLI